MRNRIFKENLAETLKPRMILFITVTLPSLLKAIQFYKQAIHLVPDIESKIVDYPTKVNADSSDSSESDDEPADDENEIENRLFQLLHPPFCN